MDSSNKPRQTSGSNTTIKPDDQSNYSLVNGCSRIEDTDKSALPDPKGSEMKPQQSWNDPCASPTSSVINNDEDPVYKDTTFSNHQSETVAKSQCRSNIMNAIGPKFIKLNRLIPSAPIEGGELVVNVSENNFSANSSSSRHMYAATAANVTFTYGRGKKARKALNDITIKVPVGTIYAILGPSGCGKTTLVHSLVGSIKPKSGYVKVFGEIPGSARSLVPGPGVGYMPQEIGLFEEFTIKETLFFFGRLYRLPREQIRDRIAFLVSFLDLPDKDCFVSKLSGGQKRRVSLAAALVHKPPLLVLDEPTVGIDPVLRQSIWNHLRSLSSKDGITVIITTHYIDEAQYANTVAFMRHGSLLEEGNPQELIKRFQLNNLEEVFLALCNHKINTTSDDEKILIETGNEKRSWNTCAAKPLLETDGENHDQSQQNGDSSSMFTTSSTETTKTNNSQQPLFSTNHSKSTSAKIIDRQSSSQTANARDLSSMSEKKTAVVIAQQQSNNINFHQSQHHHGQSTINRQPTSLSAPHVAQRLLMKRNKILDHFARSSALLTKNFIRMWRNLPVMLFASLIPVLQCTLFFLCLGRNPYDIPVSVYNEELIFHAKQTDSSNLYSLRLMNEIDNQTIQLFNVNSIDDGFETVRSGQAKAFIKFPRNFTQATFEKAVDYMSMDNQTLQHSFVDLYLDMSSQFHAMKIKEKLFEAYHRFSKKLLQENGYTPEIADSPIRIPPPIMGNENPTVTEFMAPGFIMSLSFFASIATAALTLVLERKDGLLERSLVSGVYPNEYIISHVITQTVVVIFQIILVLLLAFFIFHIPNRGPVFWISVLIVMQGVCGMAYGILISAIAKEENFTLAACMGSMFPQFLLSGVVWPVDTMPQFLIYVSTFVSQAKAIDAVRYMLYRGWDPFNHWDVALGFIISASWTVVFLFIATILFNINKS